MKALPNHLAILKVAIISLTLVGYVSQARAESMIVAGWAPAAQFDLKSQPPIWLGDDAVIGRLACPSIVRLEVDRRKNTPALLKGPPQIDKVGDKEVWTFTIRPGLRWWSGVTVDADGLAAWFKSNLVSIVKDRLSEDVTSLFEISTSGGSSVKVSWTKPPGFGPYVLSGASLYRPTSGGLFECAGLYSAVQVPGGIEMTVSKGYTSKYAKIKVLAPSYQPSRT